NRPFFVNLGNVNPRQPHAPAWERRSVACQAFPRRSVGTSREKNPDAFAETALNKVRALTPKRKQGSPHANRRRQNQRSVSRCPEIARDRTRGLPGHGLCRRHPPAARNRGHAAKPREFGGAA